MCPGNYTIQKQYIISEERVFKEWLTKKIDAMYVYIDPEFRDGEFENKSWVK